jgi:NADH-quinone oxidoreductase subunit K
MHSLWPLLYNLLFISGLTTLLLSRNRSFLIILLAFELMFFAVGVGFIYYATQFFDFKGYIYAVMLLVIAAAEASIGLALVMLMFKSAGTINLKEFSSVKH